MSSPSTFTCPRMHYSRIIIGYLSIRRRFCVDSRSISTLRLCGRGKTDYQGSSCASHLMSEDDGSVGLSCGVCLSYAGGLWSDTTDVGPAKSFSVSTCPWRILPMCVCANGRPRLRIVSSAITEGSGGPENVISISSKLPGMLNRFRRIGVSFGKSAMLVGTSKKRQSRRYDS